MCEKKLVETFPMKIAQKLKIFEKNLNWWEFSERFSPHFLLASSLNERGKFTWVEKIKKIISFNNKKQLFLANEDVSVACSLALRCSIFKLVFLLFQSNLNQYSVSCAAVSNSLLKSYVKSINLFQLKSLIFSPMLFRGRLVAIQLPWNSAKFATQIFLFF